MSSPLSASSFQWKRNGLIIPGATDSAFVASMTGSYTVTVNDTGTCTSPLTSLSTRVRIVCFPPLPNGQKIQVNDNPVPLLEVLYDFGSGLIRVNAENITENISSVHLIDNTGRQVISESGVAENGSVTNSINGLHLAPGIYTVVLQNNQQLLTKRFMKF